MQNYKITYWSQPRRVPVTWIGEAENIHDAINKLCDETGLDHDYIFSVEKITL